MYGLSFEKINVIIVATRTSSVATALKKITMITSTHNLPLSPLIQKFIHFLLSKINKLHCDFLYWKNLSLVCPLRNHAHDITFLPHQSLKASAKMAVMVNKVYCMQSLSYVCVLFHVVNGISSYTLSGVANTANIEWSSFK